MIVLVLLIASRCSRGLLSSVSLFHSEDFDEIGTVGGGFSAVDVGGRFAGMKLSLTCAYRIR